MSETTIYCPHRGGLKQECETPNACAGGADCRRGSDPLYQTTTWERGQRAVINRQTVVTIEKVTPSGRAVTDGRTFDVDGRERAAGTSYYRRARLEPLTPEIEAEMALISRSRKVSVDAQKAVDTADRWLRTALSTWSNRVPEAADVEKAELLLAAIQQIIEVKL